MSSEFALRHSRVGGNPEWPHALAFVPLALHGRGAWGEGRLASSQLAVGGLAWVRLANKGWGDRAGAPLGGGVSAGEQVDVPDLGP